MMVTALTDGDRQVYARIADALIPSALGMPSASEAGVPSVYVDQALTARPDLSVPLQAAIAFVKELPSDADLLIELDHVSADVVGGVGTLTAGAYFLSPQIRERIGYPGQEARSMNHGAELPYIGMLERLIDSGFTYIPTPAT